ncbi:MAG: SDR family oxidoreductase [Lautropia sp.]
MSAPQHVVVTGATRGIGRAIVDHLLARDQPVIGIARRDDPGFPAPLVTADLADADATLHALDGIASRYAVSGLVNNAGVNRMQALGAIDHEAFDRIVGLNCRATIDCTQALLPSIRAARDPMGKACGRIVNIASRSLLGRFEGSVYAAAKAAMVGLTRSWALELAGDGVTVNCVAPGPVATEMFEQNNPPGDPRRDRMLAAVPMRRMGEPAEIAAAVDYFLSQAAAYTTGQTLFVCGGSSISQIHL